MTWRPICRVCRENCKECPDGYFLWNASCVKDCPPGSQRKNETHCLDDLVPTVSILNSTGSNEDWIDHHLLVSRKKDLVLQMDYVFNGKVEGI